MSQNRQQHDSKHAPSGRWRLGFALAVIAVLFWSTVPIALSLLLDGMDVITITWYRFVTGVGVLGAVLYFQGAVPSLRDLAGGKRLVLLVIAGLGLTGNFVFYLYALNFIPPGASQVVMQVAPLFVLLGGVILFREPFRAVQWSGLVLVVVGMLLFFNHRLADFTGNLTDHAIGAWFIVLAAIAWAGYALAQKQLLKTVSSMGIMLVLYAFGVVVMFPFSTLSQLADLSTQQYVVLAYSCANVLIGYGCFAEALQHWEASRVSMIVCTTPLLTLAISYPAHVLWPDSIMPEDLNAAGLVGAVLVVAGSMLAALGGRQRSATPAE